MTRKLPGKGAPRIESEMRFGRESIGAIVDWNDQAVFGAFVD